MKPRSNKQIIFAIILVLYLVFTLFPFYWMINTAFKHKAEVTQSCRQAIDDVGLEMVD